MSPPPIAVTSRAAECLSPEFNAPDRADAHPLFTQSNEDLGNRLNGGRPVDDFATHGKTVAQSVASVVAANGTAEDPQAYGEKVARRFCPNILRGPHFAKKVLSSIGGPPSGAHHVPDSNPSTTAKRVLDESLATVKVDQRLNL
jgi:hypothetical protein